MPPLAVGYSLYAACLRGRLLLGQGFHRDLLFKAISILIDGTDQTREERGREGGSEFVFLKAAQSVQTSVGCCSVCLFWFLTKQERIERKKESKTKKKVKEKKEAEFAFGVEAD